MNSTLYISGNASIYDNDATSYAPGIYNGSVLYAKNNVNIIDGIYIPSKENVIRIDNALTQTAVLQINASNYVTPDPSISPILIAVGTPTYPTLTETDLSAFRKPSGFEDWMFQLSDDQTELFLVLIPPVSYTISYENLHGSTHTNPTSYTIETPTIVLTPPTPLKCRYFVGWFDINGIRVDQIPQGTVGDIVLYARWDTIGCHQKIGYVEMKCKNICP